MIKEKSHHCTWMYGCLQRKQKRAKINFEFFYCYCFFFVIVTVICFFDCLYHGCLSVISPTCCNCAWEYCLKHASALSNNLCSREIWSIGNTYFIIFSAACVTFFCIQRYNKHTLCCVCNIALNKVETRRNILQFSESSQFYFRTKWGKPATNDNHGKDPYWLHYTLCYLVIDVSVKPLQTGLAFVRAWLYKCATQGNCISRQQPVWVSSHEQNLSENVTHVPTSNLSWLKMIL